MYRTGASSGIGKACALEFARHRANLILSARRKDRLARLADEVSKINPHVAHVSSLRVVKPFCVSVPAANGQADPVLRHTTTSAVAAMGARSAVAPYARTSAFGLLSSSNSCRRCNPLPRKETAKQRRGVASIRETIASIRALGSASPSSRGLACLRYCAACKVHRRTIRYCYMCRAGN